MPDIQFFDDDQVPKPKQDVRIESLQVEMYPDKRRIWINVKVTPFQERPNLILVARRKTGGTVGELSIIETMHADMEFTLHLRGVEETAGDYVLEAQLFYETRQPPQDQTVVNFSIPENNSV